MAIIISENYQSRAFTLGIQGGRDLEYDIMGTEDDGTVEAIIRATAPSAYRGLRFESVDANHVGGGVWKAIVHYTGFENDNEYSFDTTGQTAHITQSLATVGSWARAGQTAPDFDGAIGVSDDAVEGVDITIPTFACQETHRFTDEQVIQGDLRRVIFHLTGTMNAAPFKGFDQGECLFMGGSGGKRGDEAWQITFFFLGSPNVYDLAIGNDESYYGEPAFIVDFKYGWDYLWIRYASFEDAAAVALVQRPVAAYSERVYKFGDFSQLGIGVE